MSLKRISLSSLYNICSLKEGLHQSIQYMSLKRTINISSIQYMSLKRMTCVKSLQYHNNYLFIGSYHMLQSTQMRISSKCTPGMMHHKWNKNRSI